MSFKVARILIAQLEIIISILCTTEVFFLCILYWLLPRHMPIFFLSFWDILSARPQSFKV